MEEYFMSTREMAYDIIDHMTDEQLEVLVMIFGKKNKKKPAKALQGILSEYANKDLIPLEEGAWERAVAEKYENA